MSDRTYNFIYYGTWMFIILVTFYLALTSPPTAECWLGMRIGSTQECFDDRR